MIGENVSIFESDPLEGGSSWSEGSFLRSLPKYLNSDVWDIHSNALIRTCGILIQTPELIFHYESVPVLFQRFKDVFGETRDLLSLNKKGPRSVDHTEV